MDKIKTHEREIIEDGQIYIVKVDSDTGDVISKTPAKKRRDTSDYFKKGEFFTVHIRVCKMLLTKKDYGNLTFRLLFALMERIEFNNRIRTFRQVELAQELEAHQPDISKSLKVLEKDKVIKKVNHDYYFTPTFVRYVNDGNFGRLADGNIDLAGDEA